MNQPRKVVPKRALREERLQRGWSQLELAHRLDVTVVTIKRWERGVTAPSAHFRSKLCALFDKTADELGLLVGEGLSAERTPVLLSDPALPHPLRHLIGRAALSQQLAEHICAGSGSYAITGLPGVGKTAMVTDLVHHPAIQTCFHDGILWLGLGRQPQMIEGMSHWGTILGLTEPEISTLTSLDAWARYLHASIGTRRMLVILDDAWHLAEAVIFRLGGSNCVHVLTTRFPALAHAFAPENVTHLQELNEDDSVTLLRHLAPEASTASIGAMGTLVTLVGGLPLALTLMGRYLHLQAYSGHPRRLQRAIERLSEHVEERLCLAEPQVPWEDATSWPVGTALSLQATIGISIDHLPAPAQYMFYALSLFPAKPHSFSEAAAVAVGSMNADVLDLLVDSGLLESYQRDRYQVHQIISDYARLYRTDPAVEERLITFFVDLVCLYHADDTILEQELHTITAAFALAFEREKYADLLRGVLALAPFLETRRLYALADTLLTRAHHVAFCLADYEGAIRTWLYKGRMAERRSDFTQAELAYFEGLALTKVHAPSPLTGYLLVLVGGVICDQGDSRRALHYLEEGFLLVQEGGDHTQVCIALRQLGEAVESLGDIHRAHAYYQHGLSIAQQSQDREEASMFFQNLGVQAARQGAYQQAAAYYQEGLISAQHIGSLQRQSAILMNQGMLAFHQGHTDEAIVLSLESLRLARVIGHRFRISSVLQNLGMLEGLRERYVQAETYLRESLELARDIGHRWLICETQCEWGMLLLRQQHLDVTSALFETVLTDARDMEAHVLQGRALFGLAQVEAARDNTQDAMDYARQSQIIFERLHEAQSCAVAQWLLTLA